MHEMEADSSVRHILVDVMYISIELIFKALEIEIDGFGLLEM